MSKTSLVEAVKHFDLEQVRKDLRKNPELKSLRDERGFDLLQLCGARSTAEDKAAANRQLRLAKWLVSEGFDPRVIHTTKPGEDGEAEPAALSLVFFAIARAQNNALARYFLDQGAAPSGLFAAAWWGNWEILADLVKQGEDIKLLLKHGAKPDVPGKGGRTVRDIASRKRDKRYITAIG